jgi:RNA polymerase sigma-70 factor (ECF subfamily)
VLADDVRQMLREKLFVGSAKTAPKIAEYAGTGALASWFRVTAMRTVLNLVRGAKEVPLDGDMVLDASCGQPDAEMELLKRRYRAEFKAAFAETVRTLAPRERNLLRYAYAEGLGSDDLAVIYGVHRTTVNRWLADVRAALVSGIRAAMTRELRVGKQELESILRLIQSQLEVTLGTPD